MLAASAQLHWSWSGPWWTSGVHKPSQKKFAKQWGLRAKNVFLLKIFWRAPSGACQLLNGQAKKLRRIVFFAWRICKELPLPSRIWSATWAKEGCKPAVSQISQSQQWTILLYGGWSAGQSDLPRFPRSDFQTLHVPLSKSSKKPMKTKNRFKPLYGMVGSRSTPR